MSKHHKYKPKDNEHGGRVWLIRGNMAIIISIYMRQNFIELYTYQKNKVKTGEI